MSDDVLKEFLVESHENLDRLDQELLALEENPDAKDTLASVFRTIHTIKGTSGFFGFSRLGELTHLGENLLSKMRDGELRFDKEVASALLEMVDAVREMLASIESSHDEGDNDYGAVMARLGELHKRPPPKLGELLVNRAEATPADVEAALAAQRNGDPRKLGQILVEDAAVSPRAVGAALRLQQKASEPPPEAAPVVVEPASVAEASIRVDTAVLDKLMNLAGELVLARNQMMQLIDKLQDAAFTDTCQRLNLITSELQEGVMRTRMQPVGNVLVKLPRVVRDLAIACGKQVRVELEGKETDLDRTVLEAIKDPLTHIIRNAVDHGIEAPAVRTAAGKPAEGTLRVRAFHEGGQVNLEIRDDGGGIDGERVKQKAIERGLVSAADAARMSEREVIGLLFLPGFSTAAKITSVSGRGVGMDVVKTNIEKIGGTVDVQSRLGAGTTLRIKIPLTLAIIPALIVTSAGDRYAIPQVSVHELVRLDESSERGIEHIHGTPVYRLRGNLLPLVRLDEQLGCRGPGAGTVNIVVVQAEDRVFGLVVDEVNDTEEIVVKPLDRQMKGAGPFAGATILGDGRVSLILDVRAIAERAHVLGDRHDNAADSRPIADDGAGDGETLLVLRVGRDGRVALPLAQVARLEEFERGIVERAGTREVVQYRGRILPLLRVADALALEASPEPRSTLQVVVHTGGDGRSVGLVVDRILDIVRESIHVERGARVAGVRGSAVIGKRVTELLDVDGLMRGAGLAPVAEGSAS